jgi:hypothetical protein
MKQDERNFWLDFSLFIGLLSAAFTGLLLRLQVSHTTVAILPGPSQHLVLTAHICSGFAFLVGSVTHVIWHRAWLKALRKRSIASLPERLRANRVTDRFIWITFLATFVFGALSWMIPAPASTASILSQLHGAFGMAMLFGNIAHLALHSKWIASAVGRQLQVRRGLIATSQPGGAKD